MHPNMCSNSTLRDLSIVVKSGQLLGIFPVVTTRADKVCSVPIARKENIHPVSLGYHVSL